MNVLILTNPEYEDFIYEVVIKYERDNVLFILTSEREFQNFVGGFSYDVGISFMYQHKVPAKEVNSHPWFNFHPAPLPEYKGRNLCYHAIMNGEKEFGATIHYMDEGFDTGDIIAVRRFIIPDDYNAEDLSDTTINCVKDMFSDWLPKILENTVFPRIPNRGGTYYKKSEIIEEIPVKPDEPFGQFVRAVTYKNFYPRIDIGGVKYKIVREE